MSLRLSERDRFLEAADAHRMGPRLQAACGGPAAACHVLDAKYEPGVRAILLYEHGGRLVRGDLVPDGDGAVEGVGPWIEPGVRLSRFPNDPELPTLPRVMDPAELGAALAEAIGRASSPAAARCRLRLLRYRPGKRATVLAGFPGEPPHYVLKAYHDAAKAAAAAATATRLAAGIADAGSLRVAGTVAHLPELRVVVQPRVSGTPLDALLTTPGAAATRRAVAAAGRALAELHAAPVRTGRERPVDKELWRFRSRAERIASVDAPAGAVLLGVADELLRLHEGLPEARTGLVHGDCKPSQFLGAAERVLLMDLDHVGHSDQAVDAGTFLASLRQLDVRRGLGRRSTYPDDGLGRLGEEFLEAYLDGRGDERDRVRIRWQEAVALQRKALRAYARAPRSPLALALAGAARRCLAREGVAA